MLPLCDKERKDKAMFLAAVLGDPIAHSKSPAIHNAWLTELGLNPGYAAIQCPGETAALQSVLADLREQGYIGCNLTIPHKQLILDIAFKEGWMIDPVVQNAGAANTVLFADQETRLYNTDIYGVAYTFSQFSPSHDFGKIALLGAGGAARAVALYLKQSGHTCTIFNRSSSRAEALLKELEVGEYRALPQTQEQWSELYNSFDTVIQSTSLGLATPPKGFLPGGLDLAGKFFFDLVYKGENLNNTCSTDWASHAALNHATAVDGFPMLVAQAAQAFSLWINAYNSTQWQPEEHLAPTIKLLRDQFSQESET
jgi:shikimate dehydrogenase